MRGAIEVGKGGERKEFRSTEGGSGIGGKGATYPAPACLCCGG